MIASSTVPPPADNRPSLAGDLRAERYAARHVLWDESRLPRLRGCGRSVRDAAGVAVKVTTEPGGRRRAGYAGLATCGSVWSCPVCSAKVHAQRRVEVEAAVRDWHARGGRVLFGTLTMRHHAGQSLATLWDALSKAWHATTSGRGWQQDQAEHGTLLPRVIKTGPRKGQEVVEPRVPVIRVVEVTHGESGWHVHVHALFLVAARPSDDQVAKLEHSLFRRWAASIERSGLRLPSREHGVDLRVMEGDSAAVDLAGYFAKAEYHAAAELTSPETKTARAGNRKPFELLASVVASGDADDLDLWHTWERVSQGRRQLTWSPGLRELLGQAPELTDEEIAETDAGGDVVAQLPGPVWKAIVRARAELDVLLAWERSSADGAAALRRYGSPPPDTTSDL